MSRILHWSLSAYSRIIVLYPDDLRRGFGPEMIEAFEHDLSHEFSVRGLPGAFRVWRIALREVVRIGFPEWLRIPAVAVPLIATAAAVLSQLPLLIVAIRSQANPSFTPDESTPLYALAAITIDSAIAGLTALVAVYERKGDRLISLSLG